ncbi:MAG: phosphodiester glycosidase family protein, partial [bacterium]
ATFTGRLVLENGAEVPISAVNRPPRWGGVALYTPEYGPFTAPQAFILLVREDRVVGISSGRPAIPPDGYALATAASQRFMLEGLTRGQPVKLRLALTPSGIRHALQGGPRLVENGQVHVPYHWEGFGPGFYRARTARSAIGVTSSGKVLFVTVEHGRRARSRRNRVAGMNLAELAALMRALGAREAMNLDGGGSATLVVGGRVVNALPRGERTVSATLVAVPRPIDKTP